MSMQDLLELDSAKVWDTQSAFEHLQQKGEADTKRTAERRLHELHILPEECTAEKLTDESGRALNHTILEWELEKARSKRKLVLFAQVKALPDKTLCLHANDARGARYWLPLGAKEASTDRIAVALQQLQAYIDKDIALFPHGTLTRYCRDLPELAHITLSLTAYPPILNFLEPEFTPKDKGGKTEKSPHLQKLEAESIHILREAVAEAENPAMLYSIGKDSAVMLHLARKAFYPAPPPFPLVHVDTRWKFQEMYLLRDHMAEESGMELLVHTNPEAIEKNINPFDHGSALHTDITKTQGLKQVLDLHKFDVVFGGARRDEEKSRAKERIFSFRTNTHRWDPKSQRPELWRLYNTKKKPGESIRVFPLSNWTELDIWQYIYEENIPVVPLYFAKERPVVIRNGMMIMVDDARMPILPEEKILMKTVRFRTLGCYPLTGAFESGAASIADIILELVQSRSSERQGRLIDADASASMEKKKQEGYF